MAVTYCTAAEVAGFLGLDISTTSKPTTTQLEAWINRAEAEIDRKTRRTWLAAGRTVTNETRNMNFVYNYGWGVRITLSRMNIKDFDYSAGDRAEFWTGNGYIDLITDGESEIGTTVNFDYKNGWVFLRGFVYTAIRENRFRFTYRYGETPVPDDIKQAAILLVSYYLISAGSLFWQALPMGENIRDYNDMARQFKQEAYDIMFDYQDLAVVV